MRGSGGIKVHLQQEPVREDPDASAGDAQVKVSQATGARITP